MNRSYDPHHGAQIEHDGVWSVSHKGNDQERRCAMLAGVWWVIVQRAWCEQVQRVTWAYYLTTMRGDIIYQSHDPYPTSNDATSAALGHVMNVAKDMIEDAQGARR